MNYEGINDTDYHYNWNQYPGYEELHRFCNSCFEANQHKHPILSIDKLVLPIGLLLTFGLCIGGIVYSMFHSGFHDGLFQSGIFCGFAMILIKAFTIKKRAAVQKEESGIDFHSLEVYKSQYKKGSFTVGRRFPYCLSIDTVTYGEMEKNALSPALFIPIMILLVFILLFSVLLATQNHMEMREKAMELVMGSCFLFVALTLGAGTIFRPVIKSILYGKKVKAVCVDVESYRCSTSDGVDYSYRPIYVADVDGKDYIYFNETRSNLEDSSVGDVVTIYVSKKNPYKYTNKQSFGNVLFGSIFLLSFGMIGTVMLVLGLM